MESVGKLNVNIIKTISFRYLNYTVPSNTSSCWKDDSTDKQIIPGLPLTEQMSLNGS